MTSSGVVVRVAVNLRCVHISGWLSTTLAISLVVLRSEKTSFGGSSLVIKAKTSAPISSGFGPHASIAWQRAPQTKGPPWPLVKRARSSQTQHDMGGNDWRTDNPKGGLYNKPRIRGHRLAFQGEGHESEEAEESAEEGAAAGASRMALQ